MLLIKCCNAGLQIWVGNPAYNNYIALPDAGGVFVVAALAPLSINTSGTVQLDQSQIMQVGQLVAGSIGRTFGKATLLCLADSACSLTWCA